MWMPPSPVTAAVSSPGAASPAKPSAISLARLKIGAEITLASTCGTRARVASSGWARSLAVRSASLTALQSRSRSARSFAWASARSRAERLG